MRLEKKVRIYPHGRLVGLLVVAMSAIAGISRAQVLPPAASDYAPLGMDQLQQLVAPIALYPDALLAQVLTASTYPNDVIAAAQWEDAGNNPEAADSMPWDSSVKGVARYPSVLHYMAGNGDWMNELGDVFLNQPGDLMAAVQNLRGEALAAGTLVSTPQQTVINQDGAIQIIPTDPQYIYAPLYDPQVVYAPPPYVAGGAYPVYLTFGPRVEVGNWLDFDLDWHDRAVYSGQWGRDRPWWHDHDRGAASHYLDDRPGVYRPGEFRDVQGRPIQAQASHWVRDDRKPPPRRVARPAAEAAIARPERGYQQPAPAQGNAAVQTPRGTDVARQSQRGKTSRQQAAQPAPRAAPAPTPRAPARAPQTPAPAPRSPEPTPRTPAPAQRAPEPAQRAPAPAPRTPAPAQRAPAPAPRAPARAAPRQAAPPPQARPSSPSRGGAMGGYQNGQAASQSAARGSASRGRH